MTTADTIPCFNSPDITSHLILRGETAGLGLTDEQLEMLDSYARGEIETAMDALLASRGLAHIDGAIVAAPDGAHPDEEEIDELQDELWGRIEAAILPDLREWIFNIWMERPLDLAPILAAVEGTDVEHLNRKRAYGLYPDWGRDGVTLTIVVPDDGEPESWDGHSMSVWDGYETHEFPRPAITGQEQGFELVDRLLAGLAEAGYKAEDASSDGFAIHIYKDEEGR